MITPYSPAEAAADYRAGIRAGIVAGLDADTSAVILAVFDGDIDVGTAVEILAAGFGGTVGG